MTEEQQDSRAIMWSIQAERPPDDGARQPDKLRRGIAYAMLLLMALAASITLGMDVSNYVSSVKSARGLKLEMTGLQVMDDENPRALIRFRVRNDSPLDIKIERYLFDLYLDKAFVCSNSSMYLGTDPNVDPGIYLKSQAIEQVLGPGQTLDFELTMYIYSAQMEIVRQARRSGPLSWQARAGFSVFLPYSREEAWLRLQAAYKE